MSTIVDNVALFETDVQRGLGLLVNKKLTWNENCELRKRKALGELFQLKRNVPKECHWKTKLDAYKGYVLLSINLLLPSKYARPREICF